MKILHCIYMLLSRNMTQHPGNSWWHAPYVLKVSNSLKIQIKKKIYWGAAEDDRPFKSREAAGNVDMFEIDNLTSFQPVSKLELTCRLLLEDALRSNLGLFFDDVSAFGLASVHKLSRLEESIL